MMFLNKADPKICTNNFYKIPLIPSLINVPPKFTNYLLGKTVLAKDI